VQRREHGAGGGQGLFGCFGRIASLVRQDANECIHAGILFFDLLQVGVHEFHGRKFAGADQVDHLAQREAMGH
jgi:hypothetical protein